MSLLFCRGYNVPTPFVEATMSLLFGRGYNVPTPFVLATISLLFCRKKSMEILNTKKRVGTL
jgi:hypothetical protein